MIMGLHYVSVEGLWLKLVVQGASDFGSRHAVVQRKGSGFWA